MAIVNQDVTIEVEDDDSILIRMEPISTVDLSSPSEMTYVVDMTLVHQRKRYSIL